MNHINALVCLSSCIFCTSEYNDILNNKTLNLI